MENKLDLDEVDLNRVYEALVTQIETYGGDPDWKEELVALKELRDRIGKMLDEEEEDPGCGSDCCGASCICHAS